MRKLPTAQEGQALVVVLGAIIILFLLLGATLAWGSAVARQNANSVQVSREASSSSGPNGVIWSLQGDGSGGTPGSTTPDLVYTGTPCASTTSGWTYNGVTCATLPASVLPPSTCLIYCTGNPQVNVVLLNPATQLYVTGPTAIYEAVPVSYGAYATDSKGDVVSIKSLGLTWSVTGGGSIDRVSGKYTPVTGDNGSEGGHRDNDENSVLGNVTVTVTSSVNGVAAGTLSVQVKDLN